MRARKSFPGKGRRRKYYYTTDLDLRVLGAVVSRALLYCSYIRTSRDPDVYDGDDNNPNEPIKTNFPPMERGLRFLFYFRQRLC